LLVNQLLSQQLSEEFSAVAAIEGQQNPESSVGTESTRSSWAGLPPQNNQLLTCQTSEVAVPRTRQIIDRVNSNTHQPRKN
jgi:hypothetical protein